MAAAAAAAMDGTPPWAASPIILIMQGDSLMGTWLAAVFLRLNYRVRIAYAALAHTPPAQVPAYMRALAPPGRADALEIVAADPLLPATLPAAMAGVTYLVQHASPFLIEEPKDVEATLMRPAVEGTTNVLRAFAGATAPAAGSALLRRRVLIGSSIGAVAFGRDDDSAARRYTEADWTNAASEHASVTPNIRSVTAGERAAWDTWRGLPAPPPYDLVTLCASTLFGPMLGHFPCATADILKIFMERAFSRLPAMNLSFSDVRDAVRVSVAALTSPTASGHRLLLAPTAIRMPALGGLLAGEFDPLGWSVPTGTLPTWMLRTFAYVSGGAANAVANVDKPPLLAAHGELAAHVGVTAADLHASDADVAANFIEMAYSMVRVGFTPDASAPRHAAAAAARAPRWTPDTLAAALAARYTYSGDAGAGAGAAAGATAAVGVGAEAALAAVVEA